MSHERDAEQYQSDLSALPAAIVTRINVTAGAICQASQSMGTSPVAVKNSIIERVNA